MIKLSWDNQMTRTEFRGQLSELSLLVTTQPKNRDRNWIISEYLIISPAPNLGIWRLKTLTNTFPLNLLGIIIYENQEKGIWEESTSGVLVMCSTGIWVHVGVLGLYECLNYWFPEQEGQSSDTSQVVIQCASFWCFWDLIHQSLHSWCPGV